MSMMIVEVPESTEFALMPYELQRAIKRHKGEWIEPIMLGTEPLAGNKLIFAFAELDKTALETITNNDLFDGDGIQYGWDLGWSVLAIEGESVDQSLLLPYFSDTPVFDEAGELTGTTPVIDLTNKLQVWAGREWVY